ncbi:MAG: arsenate reductase ArsC [Myxococcales bacterium]|nr:arsenate reductase ArsC [Myxococcales bacterium]
MRELSRGATPKAVLFLCTGNSCRSQMAEGFARQKAGTDLRVFSAGTDPVGVNPLAVQVMAEAGIDISAQRSKGLDAVPLGEVDLVVTLCGDAAERCPALPGGAPRLHWGLPDPAAARGTPEEILDRYREVRDAVAKRVEVWLASLPGPRPSC